MTVAITEFTTKFGREITGLCSGWLRSLPCSSKRVIPVWLKRGTMTFPENPTPLIMVGPGTGVAAFRSVIQERAPTGQKLVLIFGCRSKDDDYYYEEEWQKLIDGDSDRQPANLTVITAFSRENPSEGKTYV